MKKFLEEIFGQSHSRYLPYFQPGHALKLPEFFFRKNFSMIVPQFIYL